MDTKLLARIGAIAFVAIAIVLTAITLRDTPKTDPDHLRLPAMQPVVDPLRAELTRCQAIGQAGATDAACLQAWAENRRRFLAPGTPPTARISHLGEGR